MTSIVNEKNASIPTWTNIVNKSLPNLTRYTATLRIITIDICCEVSSAISLFTNVVQDKPWDLIHVSNDRKQICGIHPIYLQDILRKIGLPIPNSPHDFHCPESLPTDHWITFYF